MNESTFDNSDDLITPQYQHIKELAILKLESEEKREQSLIQQSSQMQTVFSFMTAAIFMALPICIEHTTLPIKFFLVTISTVVMFLIASLVLASISQWRWKTQTFPDVIDIKNEVINSSDWEIYLKEYNRIDQWVNLVSNIQSEKAKLNARRVSFIMASMICFYCSVATVVISYIIAIYILV